VTKQRDVRKVYAFSSRSKSFGTERNLKVVHSCIRKPTTAQKPICLLFNVSHQRITKYNSHTHAVTWNTRAQTVGITKDQPRGWRQHR